MGLDIDLNLAAEDDDNYNKMVEEKNMVVVMVMKAQLIRKKNTQSLMLGWNLI